MRSAAILVPFLLICLVTPILPSEHVTWDGPAKNPPATGSRGGAIIVDQHGGGNFTTIGAAVEAAGPGDTILVRAGTYCEHIVIDRPLTVIGAGWANTTIQGGMNDDVVRIAANGTRFSGFTVTTGATYNKLAGIRLLYVHDAVVSSNVCRGNLVGIYLMGSDHNTVRNNTCDSNTNDGIYVSYSENNLIMDNTCTSSSWGILVGSDNNTIEGNNCSNNRRGIGTFNHPKGCVLSGNDCHDNEVGGIDMNGESSEVRGNRLHRNGQYGIQLWYCRETSVADNEMRSCGIRVYSTMWVHWTDNEIEESNTVNGRPVHYWKERSGGVIPAGAGQVILVGCERVLVQGQNCSNGTVGITLAHSTDITLSYNRCSGNALSGICLSDSSGNRVTSNVCDGNAERGITCVQGSSENRLEHNTCNGNDVGIGVKDDSVHNTVSFNSCSENGRGVEVRCSDMNDLISNNCSGNDDGIHIYDSDGTVILDNACTLNGDGLDARWVRNSVIDGNILSWNRNGSHLEGLGYSLVANNSFANNGVLGFQTDRIYRSTVKNNTFASNGWEMYADHDGIWTGCGLFADQSSDNLFFYNDFLDTAVFNDSDDDEFYKWGEGNYWGDYKGLDNGDGGRMAGDGIGDTLLPHGPGDPYPFMEPGGWLDLVGPGTPILEDPGDFTVHGSFELSWSRTFRTSEYLVEEAEDPSFKFPDVAYRGPETSSRVENRTADSYFYRVRGVDGDLSGQWSNVVDMTVDLMPEVPTDLSIIRDPNGSVLHLSWTPNPGETDHYQLQYREEDDPLWVTLATVAHPWHSYSHHDLKDNWIYYYRIGAFDNRGLFSGYSEEVSGIPMDTSPPAPPTGLRVSDVGMFSIHLEWEPNTEGDLIGYRLYRSLNASGGFTRVRDGLASCQYKEGDLIPDTTYYYRLTALDDILQESGPSVTLEVTTLGPEPPEDGDGEEENGASFPANPELTLFEDTMDASLNVCDLFPELTADGLPCVWEDTPHLGVTVYEEDTTVDGMFCSKGTVVIRPEENWSGVEWLDMYGPGGAEPLRCVVKVTVVPVNDPPGPVTILAPEAGAHLVEGDKISLRATCEDPDLPYGDELAYKWISDIQGELGRGSSLDGCRLTAGRHRVVAHVMDSEGKVSMSTVEITVDGPEEGVDASSEGAIPVAYPVGIVGMFCVLALVFISLVIRSKAKRKGNFPDAWGEPEADEGERPTAPSGTIPLRTELVDSVSWAARPTPKPATRFEVEALTVGPKSQGTYEQRMQERMEALSWIKEQQGIERGGRLVGSDGEGVE